MSLIGPRPDPLDDMDIYTEHQKKKLAVRPGITGYNQAWGWEEHISKLDVDGKEQFYGETIYGKFDNYLVLHG